MEMSFNSFGLGTWVWLDGLTSTYAAWKPFLPTEPDGGINDNCAIKDKSLNLYIWVDADCTGNSGMLQANTFFIGRNA